MYATEGSPLGERTYMCFHCFCPFIHLVFSKRSVWRVKQGREREREGWSMLHSNRTTQKLCEKPCLVKIIWKKDVKEIIKTSPRTDWTGFFITIVLKLFSLQFQFGDWWCGMVLFPRNFRFAVSSEFFPAFCTAYRCHLFPPDIRFCNKTSLLFLNLLCYSFYWNGMDLKWTNGYILCYQQIPSW